MRCEIEGVSHSDGDCAGAGCGESIALGLLHSYSDIRIAKLVHVNASPSITDIETNYFDEYT